MFSLGLWVRAYFTSQVTVKIVRYQRTSFGLLLIQVENKIFEDIYANNKTVGKKLRYLMFSEEMKS